MVIMLITITVTYSVVPLISLDVQERQFCEMAEIHTHTYTHCNVCHSNRKNSKYAN